MQQKIERNTTPQKERESKYHTTEGADPCETFCVWQVASARKKATSVLTEKLIYHIRTFPRCL